MYIPYTAPIYWHKLHYFTYALATLMLMSANTASAIQIIVPGTSDMWLAGMPDGSTASGSDVAPDESPVLVTGISIFPSEILTFNATGGVSNTSSCPPSCAGPDGGGFASHSAGAQNGISGLTAPMNALIGVFLSDAQPDLSSAPSNLVSVHKRTNFNQVCNPIFTIEPTLVDIIASA